MVECQSKCSFHQFVNILILSMLPLLKVLFFKMNFRSIFLEKSENCFSYKYDTTEPYFWVYTNQKYFLKHTQKDKHHISLFLKNKSMNLNCNLQFVKYRSILSTDKVLYNNSNVLVYWPFFHWYFKIFCRLL